MFISADLKDWWKTRRIGGMTIGIGLWMGGTGGFISSSSDSWEAEDATWDGADFTWN